MSIHAPPTFTVAEQDFVVIPKAEYERLVAIADAAEDADEEAWARQAYDEYLEAETEKRHLAMPKAEWARIRAGESPIKVIRQFRKLSQIDLAKAAQLSQAQISALESGKAEGRPSTLRTLAKALQCPLDVLIAAAGKTEGQ